MLNRLELVKSRIHLPGRGAVESIELFSYLLAVNDAEGADVAEWIGAGGEHNGLLAEKGRYPRRVETPHVGREIGEQLHDVYVIRRSAAITHEGDVDRFLKILDRLLLAFANAVVFLVANQSI
jgi:hypothetical protein